MAALGREHRHLTPLVEMGNRLEKYEHELAETRELVDSDDPEMSQEAEAEAARLENSSTSCSTRSNRRWCRTIRSTTGPP